MSTLILQEVSPSAKRRGKDNDPHPVKPEEIYERLNQGTFWLAIWEGDVGDISKQVPDVQVQWWSPGTTEHGAWVNNVVRNSDSDFAKKIAEGFEAYKGGKMPTSEQIVEIFA